MIKLWMENIDFFWRGLRQTDRKFFTFKPHFYPVTEGYFITEDELKTVARRAFDAIDAEPELPGEMPDEMFTALKAADKTVIAEMLRIIVRQTKDGIK